LDIASKHFPLHYHSMDFVRCKFVNTCTRRSIEIDISLTWNVVCVADQVSEALNTEVQTMKFRRQLIQVSDRLTDLSLKDGSTIFVNSPTFEVTNVLTESPPLQPRCALEQAALAPPAHEVCVRTRPRVATIDKDVIKQRIDRLEELGYPRMDCEKALVAAAYNIDRASDYLVLGVIPKPLMIENR
jgi:hypothetical protein